MKGFLPTIVFVCLCGCGGWSKADTYRQSGVALMLTVDWAQTRKIAQNPDKYSEMNPVLGSHPSTGEVDAYFLTCAVAHTTVAMALPPKYREWWQYVFIGVQAVAVANNVSIGLGVGF